MRSQDEAAHLHFATWNLGGHSPGATLDLLTNFRGTPALSRLQIVFLQEITCKGGPHFEFNDSWILLHGKHDEEWRGCGIAFLKTLGVHQSTRLHTASISTQLRLHGNRTIGLISGHVSHKFSIAQTAEALSSWGDAPCLKSFKVLLGFDANETFLQPGGLLGDTTLSCTGRGEQILQWCLEHDVAIPEQDIDCPSHFPYNPDLKPRRIDYIATRGMRISNAEVGSFRDRASSDHEPILGQAILPVPQGPKREVIWCARQLNPGVDALLNTLPQGPGDPHFLISQTAKAITQPANRSSKFRESPALKQLRREAKHIPAGPSSRQAWKAISKSLQQERRQWKQSLANRAGQLDWHALRSLKHKDANTNWAARLLDDPSWAEKLQKHMESIFTKTTPSHTRSAMELLVKETELLCKQCPWRPFTEAEMRITMAKWKNHKATGPDGIALEALRVMFDHPRWQPKLSELLNDSFYRGALPPEAAKGASVLLPKCVLPANWSETRPITLSSAILKWISQLLLIGEFPYYRTRVSANGQAKASKASS